MTVSISPSAGQPTTVPAMAALLAERKVQRRDASPLLPRQSDRRTPGAAGCGLRSRVPHAQAMPTETSSGLATSPAA
jgi:hypothetical protein